MAESAGAERFGNRTKEKLKLSTGNTAYPIINAGRYVQMGVVAMHGLRRRFGVASSRKSAGSRDAKSRAQFGRNVVVVSNLGRTPNRYKLKLFKILAWIDHSIAFTIIY